MLDAGLFEMYVLSPYQSGRTTSSQSTTRTDEETCSNSTTYPER